MLVYTYTFGFCKDKTLKNLFSPDCTDWLALVDSIDKLCNERPVQTVKYHNNKSIHAFEITKTSTGKHLHLGLLTINDYFKHDTMQLK